MDKVDWSKAPEGATHYATEKAWYRWLRSDTKSHFNEDEKVWKPYGMEEYFNTHLADAIPRPQPQWQGPQDGLPPVGTECMYHNGSIYVPGKIIAHVDDGDGIDAIIQCEGRWYCGRSPDSFRPLKSDRDKSIDEIAQIIDGRFDPRKAAESLYDAGFRKESKE